jgi:hypothetical protein
MIDVVIDVSDCEENLQSDTSINACSNGWPDQQGLTVQNLS